MMEYFGIKFKQNNPIVVLQPADNFPDTPSLGCEGLIRGYTEAGMTLHKFDEKNKDSNLSSAVKGSIRDRYFTKDVTSVDGEVRDGIEDTLDKNKDQSVFVSKVAQDLVKSVFISSKGKTGFELTKESLQNIRKDEYVKPVIYALRESSDGEQEIVFLLKEPPQS